MTRYSFDSLRSVGDAFDVPADSVKLTSLRAYASLQGTLRGVRYQVRDFPDEGVYEVSLVAATRPPPSTFVKGRRPLP